MGEGNENSTDAEGFKAAFRTGAKSESPPPETGTGSSTGKKGPQTITWANPADITWGTALSGAQLNAVREPEDGGSLSYSPKEGAVLDVADGVVLKVTAAATEKYEEASATVTINVRKAPQTITWNKPASIPYGTRLSDAQLNATRKPDDGGKLSYEPGLGTVPDAGRAVALKVTAAATDRYEEATKQVAITIEKLVTVIEWSDPASVTKNTKLSGAQLNATCKVGDASKLVYDPPANTTVTTVGTNWLSVSHPDTVNYIASRKYVALMVYQSAKAREGFDSMLSGQLGSGTPVWKTSTITPDQQTVIDNWDKDVGKMKTQGKELMSSMRSMTGPELKAHMDTVVSNVATDHTLQSGTYPNHIWKLPNGLQVRYKPNGDQFNPGVPMFAIEGRTSTGFSGSQGDIAFKLMPNGEPAPKGPGATNSPGSMSSSQAQDFRRGTCEATHLKCSPKVDPVIEWSDPDPIDFGTELSDRELNARQVFGDGKMRYAPALKTRLDAGADQPLTLSVAASNRFNAATKQVKITVNKVKQDIEWATRADIVDGTPLSATQLNAVVKSPGGGALTYTPPADTVLSVGDGQVLKATAAGTKNYEQTTAQVTVNVKSKT